MSENKKKKSGGMFSRLFGSRNKQADVLVEEQVQGPVRTIISNFASNKLGMLGLILFLCIFLFVMLGPLAFPINLGENDSTQINVPPTMNMMKLPKGLDGNVRDIAAGNTYALGVDKDGEMYIWGYTKITDTIDLSNIPEEVKNAELDQIAVGYDHIVALDENGAIYVWGNTRLKQDNLPQDLEKANKKGINLNIKQIEAGYQFSVALTEDGDVYVWGNDNMADAKFDSAYRGQVEKVAMSTYNYMCLLKDGTVAYTGYQSANAFTDIPEALKIPGNVVDISANANTFAAVLKDGSVVVWGNIIAGEDNVPVMESKPVEIYGGKAHYTVLLEDGQVISWGDDSHGQSDVPGSVHSAEIETVFAGGYQNYAITTEGKTITWGLKGYPLGTDDLGRDILTRIINGGKTTMTVGFVSVVISILIGVLMGGFSGYFGGATDFLIMRVAEIVGGLPFLPFALILSAVIGTRISVEQRMYLIMVVLGVLSWPPICRLIRAQILSVREQEFVTAAKAMGVKEGKIVFKHILPNVVSILLVEATLSFATCMLTESTLSYLGFGISPPTPTWGNMLTGANNSIVIQQYWWRWVFPALVFGICTICINLMGDAMRDAVDPKSAER